MGVYDDTFDSVEDAVEALKGAARPAERARREAPPKRPKRITEKRKRRGTSKECLGRASGSRLDRFKGEK